MKKLLPEIKDRVQYNEAYDSSELWEPAISEIVSRHELKGQVSRGVLGSHIVYRVGDHWIKLMAPFFSEEMKYEVSGLRAIEGRLSVQTPRMTYSGVIEGWPYLVLTHISGEPIRDVWKNLSSVQKSTLSQQTGKVLKEISQCRGDQVIQDRFHWETFIKSQLNEMEAIQKRKGLSSPWAKGAVEFLDALKVDSFFCSEPVFLHADLTSDHFLVEMRDDNPVISGIIDLADCQVGHPEYELIAPALFIFKGDEAHLKNFLTGYGYSKESLDENFSNRLIAWSLFHRYFSFISYLEKEMKEVEPGDFSSLARLVFPLSSETETDLEEIPISY